MEYFKLAIAILFVLGLHLVYKLLLGYLARKKFEAQCKLPYYRGGLATGVYELFLSRPGEHLHAVQSLFDMMGPEVGTIAGRPPLLAPNSVAFTRDPAVVKHMLSDHFNVWKKLPETQADLRCSGFREFTDWLGNGIFAIDHGTFASDKGLEWLHQRKLAAKIFTLNNFKTLMCDTFIEKAQILVKRLVSAPPGAVLDLQDLFLRLTMDSFSRIGYGIQMDTLQGVENPYATAFDAAHTIVAKKIVGEGVMPRSIVELFLPRPASTVAHRILDFTLPSNARLNRHLRILRSYTNQIIAEKRKGAVEKQSDLLALFMQEKTKEGTAISDVLLGDIIMNLMLAGRDTTAVTLSWLFYELQRHPEVEAKLREELTESLGDELPTYDAVKGLKYLNGVVQEALRLHPAVPLDSKINGEADTLPDGTVIPRYTKLLYAPWHMARWEKLWPNANEFKPERWIEQDNKHIDSYHFPVFQAGPRVCLGKEMALLELKVVTSIVVSRVSLKIQRPLDQVTYETRLTMSIKDGLPVSVSKVF